jgi:hypothetical protein
MGFIDSHRMYMPAWDVVNWMYVKYKMILLLVIHTFSNETSTYAQMVILTPFWLQWTIPLLPGRFIASSVVTTVYFILVIGRWTLRRPCSSFTHAGKQGHTKSHRSNFGKSFGAGKYCIMLYLETGDKLEMIRRLVHQHLGGRKLFDQKTRQQLASPSRSLCRLSKETNHITKHIKKLPRKWTVLMCVNSSTAVSS